MELLHPSLCLCGAGKGSPGQTRLHRGGLTLSCSSRPVSGEHSWNLSELGARRYLGASSVASVRLEPRADPESSELPLLCSSSQESLLPFCSNSN